MPDQPEYKVYERISDEDENTLRGLIALEEARDEKVGSLVDAVAWETKKSASYRRLGQASMINIRYYDNLVEPLEVYINGFSYVAMRDAEIAEEERRKQERKEDKKHDWKIAVFTALIGVAGVVIGFVLGRI